MYILLICIYRYVDHSRSVCFVRATGVVVRSVLYNITENHAVPATPATSTVVALPYSRVPFYCTTIVSLRQRGLDGNHQPPTREGLNGTTWSSSRRRAREPAIQDGTQMNERYARLLLLDTVSIKLYAVFTTSSTRLHIFR